MEKAQGLPEDGLPRITVVEDCAGAATGTYCMSLGSFGRWCNGQWWVGHKLDENVATTPPR